MMLSILLIGSCVNSKDSDPEPEPEIEKEPETPEIKGEFTIAGKTHSLVYSQRQTTYYRNGFKKNRLLFYSIPYPVEGVPVDGISLIAFDIIAKDGDITGNYEFNGDSTLNSIIYCYCLTEAIISNRELISGAYYKLEVGKVSITEDKGDYKINMNFVDKEAGELSGNYEGAFQ